MGRASQALSCPGSSRASIVVLLSMSLLLAWPGCGVAGEESLVVTATAFNSLRGQTRDDPSIGAWGDRLVPGMKAIAVSRDLLRLGLTHRSAVRIEGLPGEYLVLDKMARRWTKRIDIYMGEDRKAARKWGRRKVRISWLGKES